VTQDWNKNNDGGGEEDVQMPLGISNDGAAEEAYVADSKPRINTSTLALFAAFGAALVVLYLLGLQNKPRAASADELAKQAAVTSAIDDMLQHTERGARINKLLDDTSRLVQLLVGALGNKTFETVDLPANPFEREMVASGAPAAENFLPDDRSEQERIRLVAEEFTKLKLQMIMMGSKPAAMIQNNIVTVGGSVGEFFKIVEIQPTRVIVSDGKRKYELKLEAGKGK